MPINSTKQPFNDMSILLSPDQGGVYALWDQGELIYYGMSSNSVCDRLKAHKNGEEGYCTQMASHFQTEVTFLPSSREHALLIEFRNTNGRKPRCNDKIA